MADFSFIQLADPQFGLFSGSSGKSDEEIAAYAQRGLTVRKTKKFDGLANETALFTRAIERANWIKPAFVVVCGDLVNEADNEEQIAEVKRIGALLDDSIDLYWVAGNHDVAVDHNNPDQESTDKFRKNFGADCYAFSHANIRFIVINSTALTSPYVEEDEAKGQISFVENEAMIAKQLNSDRIVLFSHHPLYFESSNEADNLWAISKKYRLQLLEIAAEYGITHNFAGHMHRNNVVSENGIEVVATGPVGYPFGTDPSGFRVVEVSKTGLSHEYHSLEI